MPRSTLAARLFIAATMARKAARRWHPNPRATWEVTRELLAEGVFFESALRNFGPNAMLRDGGAFFPHIFMPDYHGPHFDEALRRLAVPGLGPNVVYYSLTGRCPYRCAYCFALAGGARAPDIGDAAALDVARALARLRVPLVNVSGGEPMVRYPRLLAAVRALRTGSEVRLFTSGHRLTRPRLDELRAAGLSGVFVSLDGEDRAVVDAARGRAGAFDTAVAALETCAGSGIPTFINSVVSPSRFPDRAAVSRFLRFVEAIDPRIVANFLPQLSTGRGTAADSFRVPSDSDATARRIVETARALDRPVTMLFGQVDHYLGCPGAGGKLLNVDVSGNVTVCVSRAGLGNLLDEPFEVLYHRYRRACQRLKVGFFCCAVGEAVGTGLLDPEESSGALEAFYATHEDSIWQRFISGHPHLVGLLFPPNVGPRSSLAAGRGRVIPSAAHRRD